MKKPKVLLIGGPTAVGKTALSFECARLFNGEILSADCVQVYKHLNIGSAKPTEDELRQVKHHIIDFKQPDEGFNVSEFKELAHNKIIKLNAENKLPIIVGGTGLYMKGLLFPYSLGSTGSSLEVRQKYEDMVKEKGREFVLDKLKEIDPKSAEKLHYNDVKRVIRALEIYEVTGKTKSSQETDNMDSEYDYLLIALTKDRKVLYDTINKRVDKMFEMGLVKEVTYLVKELGLTLNNQSMNAIGYKEFFDYFDGKISLDKVKENIKQNTRRYAKRQITWFKTMPNVNWFNTEKGIDEVLKFIKQKLT